MALAVKITWQTSILLGAKAKLQANLTKIVPELPTTPGIYIFARKFGRALIPMYVGQASNGFKSRLKQQANNFRLMHGLASEKNGTRYLLLGNIQLSRGQKLHSVLDVAEQAHIEHALTDGHALLNIKGTKTKRHRIAVVGPKTQSHPFPREMFLAVNK